MLYARKALDDIALEQWGMIGRIRTRRPARICHRQASEATSPGQPKNKSQKVGVFFKAVKRGAKTPPSPRIPPRFHHQKTTSKHTVFPKLPSKTSANQQILTRPPHPKKSAEK
ncbi:hypothetical protein RBB78_07235 [Tunturiibacter empetritectus]